LEGHGREKERGLVRETNLGQPEFEVQEKKKQKRNKNTGAMASEACEYYFPFLKHAILFSFFILVSPWCAILRLSSTTPQ
jgi:hypothetical protein